MEVQENNKKSKLYIPISEKFNLTVEEARKRQIISIGKWRGM